MIIFCPNSRSRTTEKTILHIHPTYSIKPAHEDSLVRQIALNLSKQRKPSDPIPKKGTKGRLFFDVEEERKRTDFQRPLPSARDLVRFFSLKQVKTDALIIMDSADPTKVAGYLFMRKLKSPPIQFGSGIRTEIIRRSLLLASVGDLKSKKPVVRKSAEKELVGNYPYLFKGLVKPLRKRDITADFLKGVFKDLEKLGVKSKLVPNKKEGYAYINGQFIKRS